MQELKALVLAGPDPERDGVVRWRCVDLRGEIAERYQVSLHERTVGKLLRRLGLSRVQPRPHHPQRDLLAQEAFKKTSPDAWRRCCRMRRPTWMSRSGSKMRPGSASRAH
jgi:transposase